MPKTANPGDVHVNRESHMSAPVTKGLEFHLNHTETPVIKDWKDGQKYYLKIPVIQTSSEGNMRRYHQIGHITGEPLGLEPQKASNQMAAPQLPNPAMAALMSSAQKKLKGK